MQYPRSVEWQKALDGTSMMPSAAAMHALEAVQCPVCRSSLVQTICCAPLHVLSAAILHFVYLMFFLGRASSKPMVTWPRGSDELRRC